MSLVGEINKTGHPTKDVLLQIRVSKGFARMLDFWCSKTNKNRSQFIRDLCMLAFMEDKRLLPTMKKELQGD